MRRTVRATVLAAGTVVFLILFPSAGVSGVIAGADASLLPFFEQRGAVYRNAGQAEDCLALLKEHGLSCVRLRLFTSSSAQAQTDPYNYGNNLAYTLPLAARVKKAGLQLLLDFHYSDTWADPGHQAKPAQWASLSFTQLVQQVRDYSSNCIAAFSAAQAMPDYVQIGNEITGGLLWPDGAVGGSNDTPAQWSKLGALLKAAVQGIQDAAGTQMPKILIHIDRGGDWAGTQWFFDNVLQQSVPFDMLGESYYPFWHGSLQNLSLCLSNAASRYAKPVVLAETAFPWTNSYWTTNLYGFPPTVSGQALYVAALARIVLGLPAQRGAGVFWWGAEYQAVAGVNEAGFNTTSFFASSGCALPVVYSVGQWTAPIRLSLVATNGALTIGWPLSGAGASLWFADSLQSTPMVWTPVTQSVESNFLSFQAIIPAAPEGAGFFRLRSP